MAWTTARLAAGHDTAASLVTHVYWSSDGATISASLAATALTGTPKLTAATNANPCIVSNNGDLETAGASAGVTITHRAFGHDDGGPVLDTTWVALDEPAPLLVGGKLSFADGALKEHLHQTTSAPA